MTKRTINAAKKANSQIMYDEKTNEFLLGQVLITHNPYTGKRYRIGRTFGSGFWGNLFYAGTIKAAIAIAEKMNEF